MVKNLYEYNCEWKNKTISKSFSMVDLLNDIGLQDKQAIAIAINGEILQKISFRIYFE